jgi:DNA polymerase
MPNEPVSPPETPRKRGKSKLAQVMAPPLDLVGNSKQETLNDLYAQWYGCTRCYLQEFRPDEEIVFGVGNPDTDILIVGEAPGEEEEKALIPFVGASGKLLNQLLASISDDEDIKQEYINFCKVKSRSVAVENAFHTKIEEWRAQEFFVTNAVACKPPEGATATPAAIKACWDRLWNIIYVVDPMLIITFGTTALQAVARKKVLRITEKQGQVFDASYDGRFGKLIYPVMPLAHPSYLLRKADWKDDKGDYARTMRNLKSAMQLVDFLRNHHYGTPIPRR